MDNVVCYLYEFGEFRLDPGERLLLRDGHPVPLTPKAFDVLTVLVQRSGHLVEKRELLEAVWPGSFVEEGNLSVMVCALRKAFGDHRDHAYIETVSKRGYRFAADVRLIECVPFAPVPISAPGALRSSVGAQLPPAVVEVRTAELASSSSDWTQPHPSDSPLHRWLRPKDDNRLLWVVMALVPIIATGTFLWRKITSESRPVAVASQTALARSLAVLPFTMIGENGDDIYLGLGISDAVTTRLGNTRKIVIRSTSSMERYVGAARDPQAAGQEQKVDAVLDGRIQRSGDRIRLTVQLIRVSDGTQIWGDSFDEKYTNILAVEDAVSEHVARSIRLELTGAEQMRLIERPTENSEAYQAYVKGRYFWNKRTTDGLQKGLQYFQEAVALDPAYMQAYVGIADSYAMLGLFTVMPPKIAFPKAKQAANKALEMDPQLADAHATLGFIAFYYDWDGLAAENEFRRALLDDPNYALAHTWYAETLAAMGRFDEALAEAQRAEAVDPLSLTIGTNIGLISYLAGRNDHAIEALRKAIDIDPNFPRAHFRLGNAYRQKGLYQLALAEYQKAMQLSGGGQENGDQYYEASVGEAYGILGDKVEARKVLDHLIARSKTRYVPAYAIAMIYMGLAEREHVFEWLQKAYEERSTSMAYLKVDPALDAFRSDPRFLAFARSIRF
jgi:DNA-binding winged helix-turn-helix (wHTH) protein/TolB-like protein/tetratricopeptide (TPR) repeat protein